jgi:hypothetical protein
VFGVVSILATASLLGVQPAQAATNSTLNFQARLQTAAGAQVPDGFYNIQFNLYDVVSGGSTLWTETYLVSNTQGVRVKNGYVTVNLGSLTSFPGTINWDQDLWLGMTVRGTGSCAFGACTPTDSEMTPRLKLTGLPYAFRAGQLAKFNSVTGFTGVLQFQNTTGGNQIFELPDQGAGGTYTLLTGAAANGSYIQNTTSPQTADFNITGDGTIGDDFTVTGDILQTGSGTFSTATGAISLNGDTTIAAGKTLKFANSGNGNLVTLQSGVTNPSYTLTLPTALGASGDCLKDTNGSGVLGFASCGGGSGVTTVGTFSGSSQPNGATISGTTITFGPADATNPGMVSTGTQTIAGSKTFTGASSLFKNTTDSANAFQVQNVAGTSIVNVDNTFDTTNLITNPSFETNTTGWSARSGTANFQRVTTQAYRGGAALQFDTDAVGEGVNYPIQLAANTTYYLQVFVKANGAGTALRMGYSHDGTDETTYLSGTVQYASTGWFRAVYEFTTPVSVDTDAYFFINTTSGTSRTFYIDSASITENVSLNNAPFYSEGRLQLNGVIVTPLVFRNSVDSTYAFTIQTAGSALLFNADTVNNTISIGNTNSIDQAKLYVAASNLPAIGATQSGAFDLLRLTDISGTSTNVFTVGDEGVVTVKTSTNSANALRVQNASSNEVFTVDTSAAQIVLGKASTLTGKVVLQNATNANTISLQSGVTSSGYTLTLPTALGASGDCIKDTNGSGVLGFGSCNTTGVTTVGSFSASSQANGATIAGATITFGPADATNPGMVSTGTQTIAGAKTFTSDMLIQPAVDSVTAFQIKDTTGLTVFLADTVNRRVGTNSVSSASTNSQRLAVRTGDATGSGTSDSGEIIIRSGNSTNSVSGDVSFDVGSGATFGNVNIGSVFRSNAVNIGMVGTSSIQSTVNIANTSNASGTQTVAIGSNAKAANSLTLQGGSTGGINLQGFTNINASLNNATNINTGSSTSLVSIGGGSGTFALDTTNIDISAGGAISGVTDYTQGSGNFNMSGSTGTFATGSGNVSLNGDVSVTAGKNLTVAAGDVYFRRGTDYSATGTTNDVAFGSGPVIRLTGASAQTITGIAGGANGRILTLINAGSNAATLSNSSGSSSPANQIITGTGSDLSLAAGASVSLVYDSGSSRWRVIGGSGGGSGVTTVGTFSGSSQPDGATISSNTITFGPADATNPGMVSTGTQTIAGDKTLTGSTTVKLNGASAFTVQNTSNIPIFGVNTSTGAVTLQDTAGNTAFVFDGSNSHLRVYANTTTPTLYADIYYDDVAGEAVFAASSGTTRIGNGTGNITLEVVNAADNILASKTVTLAGAYNQNDFSITQTLTGGSNNISGSVLNVSAVSTTSGTNSQDILRLSQSSSSATGNLILASQNGIERFKVSNAGLATITKALVKPASNATDVFQVQDASAGVQFLVDTTNGEYSFGGATAAGNRLSVKTSGSQNVLNLQNSSGTTVFSVNSTGDLLSKASTASTTAFQVQNASSAALLTADSTNGRIQVGSSSTDGTGILFLLDSYNGSSDPTGVTGAMYYNSDMRSMRCYANGMWNDCNHSSMRATWLFQEDFASANLTTNQIGTHGWLLSAAGSGALSKLQSGAATEDADRFGVINIATTTTANSGVALSMTNITAGAPSNLTLETDLATVTDNTSAMIRIGLHDTTVATTAPTDGIYFQFDTATDATNWYRCTANNSTRTCTSTGIAKAAAGTYQRLKFVVNSAGSQVDFYIDEVSAGSNTTDLPASSTSHSPTIAVHSPGTAAKSFKIDYFQMRRNLTTLR